jgi:hypothetical protein
MLELIAALVVELVIALVEELVIAQVEELVATEAEELGLLAFTQVKKPEKILTLELPIVPIEVPKLPVKELATVQLVEQLIVQLVKVHLPNVIKFS